MQSSATTRAQSRVCPLHNARKLTQILSYSTAELEKTEKSLIAHKYAHIHLFLFALADYNFSIVDAGIKWRPVLSELPEFGPEFKEVWDSHFANAPDKPVLWIGVVSACVIRFARLDCLC
jgi:hypothetical protein